MNLSPISLKLQALIVACFHGLGAAFLTVPRAVQGSLIYPELKRAYAAAAGASGLVAAVALAISFLSTDGSFITAVSETVSAAMTARGLAISATVVTPLVTFILIHAAALAAFYASGRAKPSVPANPVVPVVPSPVDVPPSPSPTPPPVAAIVEPMPSAVAEGVPAGRTVTFESATLGFSAFLRVQADVFDLYPSSLVKTGMGLARAYIRVDAAPPEGLDIAATIVSRHPGVTVTSTGYDGADIVPPPPAQSAAPASSEPTYPVEGCPCERCKAARDQGPGAAG